MASDQWPVASFIKAVLAAFLIVSSFCGSSAAQQEKKWNVARLCGRVDQLQEIQDRKLANASSERRRGLRDLPMSLYQRRDDRTCCQGLVVLENARTARNGRFEFKTKNPGDFWITTYWNARQYKLAVTNEQLENSATCSAQGIDLDGNGHANWWVTITLD